MRNLILNIVVILISFYAVGANAMSNKPLRVCTTGDYPPLTSYDSKNKEYTGFSITAIKNFAKSINRQVSFVHTTWGNMNDDLKNKCDIAVGGITSTDKRSQLFYLSDGILPNKKAPVFSKQNNKVFDNFNSLDKDDVTILENKGGTNESFAKSHIKNAKIKILPENLAVYACLNKYPNSKYSMFTDQIEIQYHTSQKGSILSDKGTTFNINNDPVTYKVYMVNKTDEGKKLISEFNKFYIANVDNFKEWYKNALKASYPSEHFTCPF